MSPERVAPGPDKRTAATDSRTVGQHATVKGSSPPFEYAAVEFSKEDERQAYRTMLLIRRFEEKAGQLYGMGYIGGYCHLYIGQEAIVTGLKMASLPGDQTITAYRNHGHVLACGIEPRSLFAELTGRRSGVAGGKAGSMLMAAPEYGFYGGHGIIGANVPIGAGLAFANSYRDNGAVTWCFLGDAAADQGQVFETFAMATRWALPIVFVIENNRPGNEGPSGEPALAERGAAFSIPGAIVDGMDVQSVMGAGLAAADRARSGRGPTILEMRTQAYRGHSMADPAKYKPEDAAGPNPRERDPIELVSARLLRLGLAENDLREIDKEVRDIVNDAARFAQSDDEPDASQRDADVWANGAPVS